MANLLSRKTRNVPFPAFDAPQRARFEERARLLVGLEWSERDRDLDRFAEDFVDELDELDAVPSLEAAHALLEAIDRRRQTILETRKGIAAASASGSWLCYWPGRSLETGEAEIASRGFFDSRDRPPLGLWLEAVGRRGRPPETSFELAIVCWIPPSEVSRARAGRKAAVAGTLAFLDEVSDALTDQVRASYPTDPRTE